MHGYSQRPATWDDQRVYDLFTSPGNVFTPCSFPEVLGGREPQLRRSNVEGIIDGDSTPHTLESHADVLSVGGVGYGLLGALENHLGLAS